MLQLLEKLLIIIAAQVHLIIHHVQQSIALIEAAQPHSQSRPFFLAIAMLEAEQSFETEGERRDADESDAAVGGSDDDDLFAGLAD